MTDTKKTQSNQQSKVNVTKEGDRYVGTLTMYFDDEQKANNWAENAQPYLDNGNEPTLPIPSDEGSTDDSTPGVNQAVAEEDQREARGEPKQPGVETTQKQTA